MQFHLIQINISLSASLRSSEVMTDQSSLLTSMWAFVTACSTPASLFLLLNLIIATIVITSRFHKRPAPQHHGSPQLARVPSLLERVKSINLSLYNFHPPTPDTAETHQLPSESAKHTNSVDPPRLVRTPSLLDRVKSINLASLYRSESIDKSPAPEHVIRSNSDKGGKATPRQRDKMKKSATTGHLGVEEEKVEDQRRATARMEKTESFGGDEAVDAKADDFINRFKHQLKLQRLDSLLRYREMLNRISPKPN